MKKDLSRRLLKGALVGFLFLWMGSVAWGADYSRLVIFGDSLSDVGNMKQVVPSEPERWSNGKVWVEYLAQKLAIPSANVENHAYGGAMTSGHIAAVQLATDGDSSNDAQIPVFQALGFSEQVASYASSSPDILAENTLFALWVGGNDMEIYLKRLQAGDATAPDAGTFVRGAMETLGASYLRLARAGARHFLVVNLPDLATTPLFASASSEVQAQVGQLTQAWNQALSQTITQAESAMVHMGMAPTFHRVDVSRFLSSTIEDGIFPDHQGTLVVLNQRMQRTSSVNTPASDYLWWDSIHPTTRAHELLAKEVFDRNFKAICGWQAAGIVGRGGMGELMAPEAESGYFYLLADGEKSGYARRGEIAEHIRTTHNALHNLDGNPNYAKRGAAMRRTFHAEEGDILSFRYKFLTREEPGSLGTDYGFFFRYDIDSGQRHNLFKLADVNSSFFPSSSGNPFFYETSFQTYTHTFSRDANYMVGFGVINSGANRNASALVVDSVRLMRRGEEVSLECGGGCAR